MRTVPWFATRATPAALLALIASAWALVGASSVFGAGELLDHDRIFATAPDVANYAGFGIAWLVMVVAMMLPAATTDFATRSASHGAWRTALRLGGYLAAWELFGFGLLCADAVVHRTVDANAWLGRNDYLVWVGVLLLVAGAQTYCAWRRRLDAVALRHPAAHDARGSFVGGVTLAREGVGMCGGVMLFMLAASLHDVRSLALLTAVGAYQQLGRWGGFLAIILAVVALGDATYVLAIHAASH